MAHKDKVKALIGGGLNAYHQGVKNQINRIDKENKSQEHMINVLTKDLTKDYISKTEEGAYIDLENSKDGMIFLDRIEGKTLINLCPPVTLEAVGDGVGTVGNRVKLLRPVLNGTKLTVAFDVSSETNTPSVVVGFYSNKGEGCGAVATSSDLNPYKGKRYVKTITINSPYECAAFGLYIVKDVPVGSKASITNITITEGDTHYKYFDGISSVGSEVDEIEVSSVNDNLFNSLEAFNTTETKDGYKWYKLKGKPNTSYVLNVNKFDSRNKFYGKVCKADYSSTHGWFAHTTAIPAASITFTTDVNGETGIAWSNPNNINTSEILDMFNSITVNKGYQPISYQPHKEDKKPILFKDVDGNWKPVIELRGLETIYDTIELHDDGKYYYHIRTIYNYFNSIFPADSIRIISDYGDVTRIDFINLAIKNIHNAQFMCDKFKKITITTPNEEGVNVHATQNGTIQLQLKTSKLSTKDASGVVEYLKSNPFIMLTEAAEEKIFEVDPITLICYANSAILTNTNIAPTITARYSGQAAMLAKAKKSKEFSNVNTNDIEQNIVPYLMDMDYRVALLQINSGVVISQYKSLGNTFEMLKRDVLSKRYSNEEYKNRIDVYFNLNRITQEEYEKLGELLNE